ncbi:tripartite tricarboxylate transporter substrate binding protein [Rhodovarius crocodyli]|uniref:Tripartite tricarboxylate transporter substrate binding protein n=1 Tax=Rhodovarius crocodyli TaxID=1979269 RepID=A0A437M1J3_9PROT|nr:tripartite tricarboxylate transporter substrate binding protein [Rhodovarius crocodyli]RVT91581.1 tripartite tricarboxylate transporter substrate binding protein [Rhodovarius crocodyli]
MIRVSRRVLPALFLAAPMLSPARAQSGSIRIVVPFPPGGITDVLARALAQQMTPVLGSTVVVENRPGANGSIGANAVARSAPDGHTLLLGVTDTHAVNPAAMRNLPYDALADFAPISNITNVPLVLAAGPTRAELTDLPSFIAAAKAAPGVLTHSSWGVGSTSQIAMLRLAEAAGFEVLHVPFTGAAPAAQALAAGQVDSMVLPAGAGEALSRDGRVRLLAALSPQRLSLLPNLPTLQEQGVALSVSIFQAVFAPARTPAAIITRYNQAMGEALRSAPMQEVLRAQAALADFTTPQGLTDLVKQEQEAWGRIVRAGNIRLD